MCISQWLEVEKPKKLTDICRAHEWRERASLCHWGSPTHWTCELSDRLHHSPVMCRLWRCHVHGLVSARSDAVLQWLRASHSTPSRPSHAVNIQQSLNSTHIYIQPSLTHTHHTHTPWCNDYSITARYIPSPAGEERQLARWASVRWLVSCCVHPLWRPAIHIHSNAITRSRLRPPTPLHNSQSAVTMVFITEKNLFVISAVMLVVLHHSLTIHRAIMWKHVTNKTGRTQCIATPPDGDRVTAIGNMHQQSGEVWLRFRVMWVERQTDRQTNKQIGMHITILCTFSGMK